MEEKKPEKSPFRIKKYTHLILFIITVITTTLSGAEWMYGRWFLFGPYSLGWKEFFGGFEYSIPFLLILTTHEFGHYFTARYHKIKTSLPYYIPMWIGFMPSFGTMGAFIRIKERANSRVQNFDIGVSGPLAGFVIALIVLTIGYTQLPPKEYVLQIHPEYEALGPDYDQYIYTQDTFILKTDVEIYNPEYAQYLPDTIYFSPDRPSFILGTTILFDAMKSIVPEHKKDRIPNAAEIMHYPWLLAGFLALIFTALNLLPIGQLDGGHVVYGLFGAEKHAIISRVFFILFIAYAGIGVISPYGAPGVEPMSNLVYIPIYVFFLYYILGKVTPDKRTRLLIAVSIFAFQYLIAQFYPNLKGYYGWLLFAYLIGRLVGVDYPPARIDEPLDTNRRILGWLALIVFIISFSLQPLILE